MKKLLQKISLFAVAFCVVFTAAFSAACKNDDNNPAEVGYSVTVVYPDGTPVKPTDSGPYARGHVAVTLQDENGNDLTDYESGILNEYGTAHTDYKIPGEYKIAIHYIPEGYDFTADVRTNAEEARYTVQLENKLLEYSVNVKMPDGSAYANAKLNVMKGDTLVKTITTDAQGNASTGTLAADNYNIVVDGLSKDYGYKPAITSKTSPSVGIKIFDVHKITFADEDVVSDEELKSWVEERNFVAHKVIDTSVTNYVYEADVADGTEYFYRIYAPWTGTYNIHFRSEKDADGKKKENANYTYLCYRDNFGTPDDTWTVSGELNSGNNSTKLSLNEGDEYIIAIKSNNGQPYKMRFLMSFEWDPYKLETSAAGEYELDYTKTDYAIVKFRPSTSGKYSITSLNGNSEPELIALSSATLNPLPGDYYSEVYETNVLGVFKNGENGNFTFEEDVRESNKGATYIYRISLKGQFTYPAKLKIKIERTGDASPDIQYQEEKVNPSEKLTQQQTPSGTWTWLDVNGEEPTADGDGNWFITKDGQQKRVYVAITRNLNGANTNIDYSFATIEYKGDDSSGPSGGNGGSQTQKNNYLTVTVQSELKKYNYTDFIKTYSGYCTADGAYPLNGELKTFLERYTAIRWTDLVVDPNNSKPAHTWLLGCGYYA